MKRLLFREKFLNIACMLKLVLSGFLATVFAANSWAEPVEVGQKDKTFTVSELKVKVGDTVRFVNQDPFFHNVFSLSDAKLFDLGSFPKGEHKDVVFDQKGKVDVECALHPNMQLTVIVE